jgi:glycosyltransferase involved in cell wall biosynthesis
MRLFIVTQKVDKNDPVLGFFHDWITEFAANAEHVIVVALAVGAHDLPKNVSVFSLGKEKGHGRIERTKRFYWHVFDKMDQYDAVFVHMNPVYAVMAGLIWRLKGKRVALWYTHRAVTLALRLAVFFSHIVFTATREGCRVRSKKVRAVGHGVNVRRFERELRPRAVGAGQGVRIVHVGRITPIKNCDTIVAAAALLRRRLHRPVSLSFTGGPATESDERYASKLVADVRDNGLEGVVGFTGAVRHEDLPVIFSHADVSVNAAPTGGLDKAVLESMAAGVPALTSNQAFRPLFGDDAASLTFRERDAEDLAAKIAALLSDSDLHAIVRRIRVTARQSDVHNVIATILGSLEAPKGH